MQAHSATSSQSWAGSAEPEQYPQCTSVLAQSRAYRAELVVEAPKKKKIFAEAKYSNPIFDHWS